MCEILVRAVDGTCDDPTANPRRGYLVVVQPDGHAWGNGECPPEYFIVKIPGLSPELTRLKTETWRMKIQFEVLSSIPATDTHTIRISATQFNSIGEGKITENHVRTFLENWGAKDIVGNGPNFLGENLGNRFKPENLLEKSIGEIAETVSASLFFADNSVTFTAKILDAIQTSRFCGGLRIDDLFFEEKSYTPATGNHRIEINYSLKTFQDQNEKDQFIRAVRENATLVSHDAVQKIIVLDILRSKVQQNFMDDVRERVESVMLRRRRFRLSETAMTEIGNTGGMVTINSAKLNSSVIDAITE